MLKEKNKTIYILAITIIMIGIVLFFMPLFQKNKEIKKEEEKIQEFFEEDKEVKEEIITTTKTSEKEYNNTSSNYVMVIDIPKMNLKKGLYDVSSKYNNVNKNIQIMKQSDMPDVENGNLILASHNGNSRVSYFDKLNYLKKGDEVYIYYKGYKYTYEISHMYDADKNGTITVHRDNKETVIVLISCKKGTSDKQIVYIGNLKSKGNYGG